MTGFKNFLLRGNLVDLAVAVIIGVAFGAVVTAFTAWLTSQPARRRGTFKGAKLGEFGFFMNAVISFVILAAVVYFLVVMPYTKAKERYFPSPEPGTPADIAAPRRRSATSSPPAARPRADPSESPTGQPWWGGTWRPQPLVAGSLAPRSAGLVVVPLVARGLGQYVAEDRGEPLAPLPVGLGLLADARVLRLVAWPVTRSSPRLSASACSSSVGADGGPDGEPLGEPARTRTAPRSRAAAAALIASLVSRLVSGSSAAILRPQLVGLRQPGDPARRTPGAGRTPRAR